MSFLTYDTTNNRRSRTSLKKNLCAPLLFKDFQFSLCNELNFTEFADIFFEKEKIDKIASDP